MDKTNDGVVMNKFVCFNELSIAPYCKDEDEIRERLSKLVEAYNILYKKGYKCIASNIDASAVMLTEHVSLREMCGKYPRDPMYIILMSMWGCPIIPERYTEIYSLYSDMIVEVDRYGDWISADGFSGAVAGGTFCIGFQSDIFWKSFLFSLRITTMEDVHEKHWLCISHKDQLNNEEVNEWLENLQPIDLVITTREPHSKSIRIRDDHGKDVLLQHARCLCNSQYVEAVLDSLPWNPHATNYIHYVAKDGIIKVVLTDTDNGLGLLVKTTGRSLRETSKIAEILEEKYGR